MLKSSFSSLPTSYLLLFSIHIVVAAGIERIQRNFFMGFIREECFKYSLMAWEKVCLPYELGGLGIMKLLICGGGLLLLNMERANGGGVL